MAQANAGVEYAVEIGTWVESDTPKRNGTGMRKVWVAGDAGDATRIAVIARTDGKSDRHLVTLPVGDADARDIASHVLTLALQGVQAYATAVAKPAPAKKPAPAPKAPTPPKAPEAVAANRAIAVANARAARPAPAPKVAAPAPAAPASAYSATDWAALLG